MSKPIPSTAPSSLALFLCKIGISSWGGKLTKGSCTGGSRKNRYCEISAGTKVICDHAFDSAKEIYTVKIPSTVEVIGENALSGEIDRLVFFKSYGRPTDRLVIKKQAFLNLPNLKALELPKNVTYIGAEVFGPHLEELTFTGPTAPEFHPEAFKRINKLGRIIVPTDALEAYKEAIKPTHTENLVTNHTAEYDRVLANAEAAKKAKEAARQAEYASQVPENLRDCVVRVTLSGDNVWIFDPDGQTAPLVFTRFLDPVDLELIPEGDKKISGSNSASGPVIAELCTRKQDAEDENEDWQPPKWDLSGVTDKSAHAVLTKILNCEDDQDSLLDALIMKHADNNTPKVRKLCKLPEDDATIVLEYHARIDGDNPVSSSDFDFFGIETKDGLGYMKYQGEVFEGLTKYDEVHANFEEKLEDKAKAHESRMKTVKERRKSIDGLFEELDERLEGKFKEKNRMDLTPSTEMLNLDMSTATKLAIFDFLIYKECMAFSLAKATILPKGTELPVVREVELPENR